jgi:hypothetical protein
MDQLWLKLLTGGVFAAVITGIFKIATDFVATRRAKAALIHGFIAEIDAGFRSIPASPTAPSEEEARFLASDGIPYQFYDCNKEKIGLVGATIAEGIVSYYSTRWQLYRAGQILEAAREAARKMRANPDELDTDGLERGARELDSAQQRLWRLLPATKEAASVAIEALRKS